MVLGGCGGGGWFACAALVAVSFSCWVGAPSRARSRPGSTFSGNACCCCSVCVRVRVRGKRRLPEWRGWRAPAVVSSRPFVRCVCGQLRLRGRQALRTETGIFWCFCLSLRPISPCLSAPPVGASAGCVFLPSTGYCTQCSLTCFVASGRPCVEGARALRCKRAVEEEDAGAAADDDVGGDCC